MNGETIKVPITCLRFLAPTIEQHLEKKHVFLQALHQPFPIVLGGSAHQRMAYRSVMTGLPLSSPCSLEVLT